MNNFYSYLLSNYNDKYLKQKYDAYKKKHQVEISPNFYKRMKKDVELLLKKDKLGQDDGKR